MSRATRYTLRLKLMLMLIVLLKLFQWHFLINFRCCQKNWTQPCDFSCYFSPQPFIILCPVLILRQPDGGCHLCVKPSSSSAMKNSKMREGVVKGCLDFFIFNFIINVKINAKRRYPFFHMFFQKLMFFSKNTCFLQKHMFSPKNVRPKTHVFQSEFFQDVFLQSLIIQSALLRKVPNLCVF